MVEQDTFVTCVSPRTLAFCVQVVLADRGKVLHVHRLAPSYITTDFFPAPVGGTCGGFLCDEVRGGDTNQVREAELRVVPRACLDGFNVRLSGMTFTAHNGATTTPPSQYYTHY